MVNETLLYAAAGLAAAEVTGVTNFTAAGGGGGDSGGGGRGGRPQVPNIDLQVPGQAGFSPEAVRNLFDSVQGQAQAAADQAQQAPQVIEVPTLPESFPTPQIPDIPDVPDVPDVPDIPGGGGGGGSGGGTTEVPGFFEGVTGMQAPDPAGFVAEQAETTGDVVGVPGRGAAESGGLFGFVYDAGQATGAGYNEAKDLVGDALPETGVFEYRADDSNGDSGSGGGGGGSGGSGSSTESGGLFEGGVFGGGSDSSDSPTRSEEKKQASKDPEPAEVETVARIPEKQRRLFAGA